MHKIETIGENLLYLKATGNLSLGEAEQFVGEFTEKTNNMESFSVIVDLIDAVFLSLDAISPILELLKKDNVKIEKSAFVICCNPPLDTEFQYIVNKAESPKRKIVGSLEEAKEWLGISEIIIQKD